MVCTILACRTCRNARILLGMTAERRVGSRDEALRPWESGFDELVYHLPQKLQDCSE